MPTSKPKHRRRLLAALALGFLLTLALAGVFFWPSPPLYTVTDLGTLPGATVTSASGLNNRGDMVGLSGPEGQNLRHTFLYRDGVMTDLGRPDLLGGPAINDSGQITGVMSVTQASGCQFHAFLSSGGRRQDIGVLTGARTSIGESINAQGQIAGEAWGNRPGDFTSHAFLYRQGRVTNLGALPGCTDATPTGINAAGKIVGDCERPGGGMQAFVYDSRTRRMAALATPPGVDSAASGINNRGQIIGSLAWPGRTSRAMLWTGGQRTDLGTLPGTDSAEGAAVNDAGVAVGRTRTQTNALSRLVNDHPFRLGLLTPLIQPGMMDRAFVYRDGKMRDLNGLIPAHSGWTLEGATAINDRGQIVGDGLHRGQRRAFLLTPVR